MFSDQLDQTPLQLFDALAKRETDKAGDLDGAASLGLKPLRREDYRVESSHPRTLRPFELGEANGGFQVEAPLRA